MGLIGTNSYGVQEKNWGYRFIEKSPLDLNGFASTADLGIGISKTLPSNLHISLQFVNGEGYNKPQSDKHHKTSLNVTYGESNISKNTGYNAGIVYSTGNTDLDPITMTSVFGGYAADKLKAAIRTNIENSFCSNYKKKDIIELHIAHNEGNYFANNEILQNLDEKNLIAFKYCDKDGNINNDSNPNGSSNNIAGILNQNKNILGMMPHPERLIDPLMSGEDGSLLFQSLIKFK